MALSPVDVLEIFGAITMGLYVACISDSAPPAGMHRAKLLGFILGAPFIWVAFILTSPVWGGMFVRVMWQKFCTDWAFAQIGAKDALKEKREAREKEKIRA